MKRKRTVVHDILWNIFLHALGVAIGLINRFSKNEEEEEETTETLAQPQTEETQTMEKPIRYLDLIHLCCPKCNTYMQSHERHQVDVRKCIKCGYELFVSIVITDNHEQGAGT